MIIKNARLILNEGITEDGFLQIENGKIVDLGEMKSSAEESLNYTIIPGLIDVHVHPMHQTLETVKQMLYEGGVTSFLATTMSEEVEDLKVTLNRYAKSVDDTLIGIHLEGPFLNPLRAGAQDEKTLIEADIDVFNMLYEVGQKRIVWMSVAPERLSKTFCQALPSRIKLVAGHTDGDALVFEHAKRCGIRHLTHAFNAMRGLHHRETSLLLKALLDPAFTVEVIADGAHVSFDMLKLIYRLKKGRMFLVSDQLCIDNDTNEAVYKNDKGELVGASKGLYQGFLNMLDITKDIVETVKMVSYYPAVALGIDDVLGSLAIGNTADFVVLDDALKIIAVYKKGKCVFGGLV